MPRTRAHAHPPARARRRLQKSAIVDDGGNSGGEGDFLQHAIVGLLWGSFGPAGAGGEPTRHFVLAVTSRQLLRYCEFSGGPSIKDVFAAAASARC